jgi:hypothetical protein
MSEQFEMFHPALGLGGYKEHIKPAEKLHRATDFDTARKAARSAEMTSCSRPFNKNLRNNS